MESAVMTLAQIENSAAVQKAITHYEEQMNQKIQMPTETLQEVLAMHRTYEREATKIYMKNSFMDVDKKFQEELQVTLALNMLRVRKMCVFLRKDLSLVSKTGILSDLHRFPVTIEWLDSAGLW